MSSTIIPLVDVFPDDDKEYVVWAFGCLKKNTSEKSITPLVEVALTEIRPTGKLAGYSESYFIPVTELDIVHLWSIWKNKKRLEKTWDTPQKSTAKFEFDLSNNDIEALEFFSKRPGTEKYYIPNNIYNFNNLDRKIAHARTLQRRRYFSKAKITKLITKKGCEVLIPSLELFSSMYTPYEKEIRRKLLTKSFEDVVSDYVNITETKQEKNSYNVSLKSSKEASNIVFLSYLALNPITRQRVSKLWASIMAGEGDYFPAVSPYQPEKLNISAEGLWLDKGKSFLVLKIKKYSLPDEFGIVASYPEYPKIIRKPSQKTKKRRNNYMQHEIKEMALTSEFDPGIIYSPVYLSSDIECTYDEVIFVQKLPFQNSKEVESNTTSISNNMIDAPHLMSSGLNSSSIDNKNTAGIKIEYKDFNHKNIVEVVYKTLISLCKNQSKVKYDASFTGIAKIISYDEEGNIFADEGYGKFPKKLLDMKKIGPWSIIKVNRKPKAIRSFLLAKIVLENNKSAYILEVQRSPSEQFSGMFFQTRDHNISKNNIEELLISVASTKGRLTRHTDLENKTVKEIQQLGFIKKLNTFNHKNIQNEETNQIRMKELIQEAIYHEVFK